ncbi:SWIB/MDM2 domain containing protein [Coccidioides posadasii C735 delta SOWgp]|nr:SWIB/MDM2 domain containing protein [Coccidioides posadasii C735 delta SOWgp]EER29821.1 SWIB/MDM2 domain containing protein [Coccidioides posadasii C735 delta SOWgp]|eukprot:XP_003071966.1 SWIB/MDM2 domain containing protein [Coccidioides posadasii C735 delta SOWgp]
MQRFDIFADLAESGADMTAAVATGPAVPVTSVSAGPSSRKRSPDAESPSEGTERYPPQKKRKSDLIDADAAFAAKLQAEENSRARPTRAAKKAAPSKKKKPAAKSKTSKKVKASDDSELEGSGSEKKKEVNRSGGFHKPLNLSPALSALFDGEISLSRPQSVKRIWKYIHDHGLQDPSDRRQIRCDERMRAVFKQDRVHMFTMTKILNQNLYNPDE